VGAVADCFVLSFRAIAKASRFPWRAIDCAVSGQLDRVDKVIQFTAFDVHAHLQVSADVTEARAQRLLEKAETACLISNSLRAQVHLHTHIEVIA
jgi:organic hydroperoxide reductase OsmC/OhrA